jgi:ribosomal protein S18 acetylase RimI-like enzyme
MSSTVFTIRDATHADGEAILALMPRLADYDTPPSRDPKHLWMHDAELLEQWRKGDAECLVHVAVDADDAVLGFSLVRMRPELLSLEPSAHLEAIAIDKRAEGMGIGTALLAEAEASAKAHGAETMTLHVFAVNSRARALYEKVGYEGELMRYIKPLGGGAPD